MNTTSTPDERTAEQVLAEVIRLVRRHVGRIMSVDEADDVAQEAAIRCWERMQAGRWYVTTSLPAFVRGFVSRYQRSQEQRTAYRAPLLAEHARVLDATQHCWMRPDLALDESERAARYARTIEPRRSPNDARPAGRRAHGTRHNGQRSCANGQTIAANGHATAANGHATAASGHATAANGRTTTASGHATAASGQTSSADGPAIASSEPAIAASEHATCANGRATAVTGHLIAAIEQDTSANGRAIAATEQDTSANGCATAATGHAIAAIRQDASASAQAIAASAQATAASGQTTAASEQGTATTWTGARRRRRFMRPRR
jgi:hypothetical protein